MKLANHTALKEWSTVIDALGRGEQVILIRKGGIADPKFGLDADRFYLYPTYFHQEQSEPDEVTITHWCEVVRTWRVHEIEPLAPLVVISRAALEARYRFRPDQALHVVGVRAFALPQPRTIKVKGEYLGCKSWVSIDDEIDVDGSTAALREEELQARLEDVGVGFSPRRNGLKPVPT
jgi:hypothetical protein